jgi:hypothetical protein
MPASSCRLIQYLVCSGFGSIIIESGSDSPPPPPKPVFAINPEPDPVPEPGSRPESKTSFFYNGGWKNIPIKNCNIFFLRPPCRISKLQTMKFLYSFLFCGSFSLCVHEFLSETYILTRIQIKCIRIRIRNCTGLYPYLCIQLCTINIMLVPLTRNPYREVGIYGWYLPVYGTC